MTFRYRKLITEGFGAEVRLENEGELLKVPSAVSEETREAEFDIQKQVDNVLVEQDIVESAEADAALVEDIAETVGDEEVSDEHAETLELITEHFANKWGIEQRQLSRESFKSKDDRKLGLEAFAAALAGAVIGLSIYVGAITAMVAALIYLSNKLVPYRTELNYIGTSLANLGESEYLGIVKDKGFFNLGKGKWLASLNQGDEFIGNDMSKINKVVDELKDVDGTIADIKAIVEASGSDSFESLAKISSGFISQVSGAGIPVMGNKFVMIETEEVEGKKIITSAKIVKSEEKAPRTSTALTISEMGKAINAAESLIANLHDNKKLKALGDELKAATKTSKGSDSDESDKIKAKSAAALLLIIQAQKLDAVKHIIHGITGYASASMGNKVDKRVVLGIH